MGKRGSLIHIFGMYSLVDPSMLTNLPYSGSIFELIPTVTSCQWLAAVVVQKLAKLYCVSTSESGVMCWNCLHKFEATYLKTPVS